jgi:hypothetical protein
MGRLFHGHVTENHSHSALGMGGFSKATRLTPPLSRSLVHKNANRSRRPNIFWAKNMPVVVMLHPWLVASILQQRKSVPIGRTALAPDERKQMSPNHETMAQWCDCSLLETVATLASRTVVAWPGPSVGQKANGLSAHWCSWGAGAWRSRKDDGRRLALLED